MLVVRAVDDVELAVRVRFAVEVSEASFGSFLDRFVISEIVREDST